MKYLLKFQLTVALIIICILFLNVDGISQKQRGILLVPSQYATIQSAINSAGIGDTVLVSAGVYSENINFFGKSVMVASQYLITGDSAQIIQTIIDGGNNGAVVTFNSLETENSLLVGFTLRNGQGTYGGGISCVNADPIISNMIIKNCAGDYGGGIYLYESNAYIWRVALTGNTAVNSGGAICCDSYSYPAIYNSRFVNNSAATGGAINCYQSAPYIANFEIEDNDANYGAGIYLYQSSPLIWDGFIQGNTAVNYGGGIECDYYSQPVLSFLQINNNSSVYGGGIHLSLSDVIIENSTITANNADYGAGIYCYYSNPQFENNIIAFNEGSFGLYAYESDPQIAYSNFWENQSGNLFNTDPDIGSFTQVNVNSDSCDIYFNIIKDPGFVNLSGNDFNLESSSRCIDAGNPASPSDPDSSTRDIGRFYYHQSFVSNFNCDISWGLPPLTVQFSDQSTGNPIQWEWDFNNDGVVDSYEQNPQWTFEDMSYYTVSLRCSRGFLTDKRVKPDFIRVYFTPKPGIKSVEDVPDDQGGWVNVRFYRSVYDTDTLADRGTESYTVQYNTGDEWVSANSAAAFGADEYVILCHTPFDSTAQGNGLIDFRIIASMDEGNFASNLMQGYSVDNLSPQVPESLLVTMEGDDFMLTWNEIPDPDFSYYAIYKSDENGFFGGEPDYYTTTPQLDALELETDPMFYAVKSVDYAGNMSELSEVVDAPMIFTLEFDEGWSSLSGYISPVNSGLDEIFSGLENQVAFFNNLEGYWMPGSPHVTLNQWDSQSGYQIKMTTPATLELKGFYINEQVIQLEPGWNLIPVLSVCPVNVGELIEMFDDEMEIIKDAVGLTVAWPSMDVNTLTYLYPGKAYLIYMNESAELTFPSCE